jgi:hypothetical protein
MRSFHASGTSSLAPRGKEMTEQVRGFLKKQDEERLLDELYVSVHAAINRSASDRLTMLDSGDTFPLIADGFRPIKEDGDDSDRQTNAVSDDEGISLADGEFENDEDEDDQDAGDTESCWSCGGSQLGPDGSQCDYCDPKR